MWMPVESIDVYDKGFKFGTPYISDKLSSGEKIVVNLKVVKSEP